MDLTQDLLSVLFYLSDHRGERVRPIEVGLKVGNKPQAGASSWGSSKLKALEDLGLVQRSEDGGYNITKEGTDAADVLRPAREG